MDELHQVPPTFIDNDDLDGLWRFVEKHYDAIAEDFRLAWNTGWAFFRLGSYDDAIRYLKIATALEPTNHKGPWGLASVYQEDAEHAKSEQLYRKALELKDTWAARHGLAVLMLTTGRPSKGETLLREGLALKPRSRMRTRELADYLEDVGKLSEASALRATLDDLDNDEPG